MKRKTNGFTLAELLIVVAIIAVLVAISIPIFTSQLEKARQATDKANARSAYAAATADWMTKPQSEDAKYVFNGSDAVLNGPVPQGYGKSSTDSSEWENMPFQISGVPLDSYVTVSIDKEGKATLQWGGSKTYSNDSAGRREHDIDNMHAIANALDVASKSGNLRQAKNYVQVAVFQDGTMAYFQDSKGNSDADTKTIRDALEAAGINTEHTDLNSTDANWKYGYVIHYDKNGSIHYKAISEAENESKVIVWNWWNKKDLEDEDLIGGA